MNDTLAPNPRRSLPWLAWGLINIVSLVLPWAVSHDLSSISHQDLIFSLFVLGFGLSCVAPAFAAGIIDGRPRILALLTLSGWAVLFTFMEYDGLGVGFALLFASMVAAAYPVVVAVFFGMGRASKAPPHRHKPDSDLERLVVTILWLAVIITPLSFLWFGPSFSLADHPGEYAAMLLGVVAVYVGLKKGLSAPPSKSETELEAILKTIQGGECQIVEFNDGADLEKIGEAVAAFANTVGGILILGVSDDGKIVGVQDDSEALTKRLTSFLQSGFSAPVQARLGHTILPEGRIHWIEVSRQLGEPLRYNRTVYVRHGRSDVEPSPLELAELYNMFEYNLTPKPTV